MYGESTHRDHDGKTFEGLSPRVRGIPAAGDVPLRPAGSIPACTGNPSPISAATLAIAVYPRVYGESTGLCERPEERRGLSPRVRGIRMRCARGRRRRVKVRVYPRVYGESMRHGAEVLIDPGLSPRVRGIPSMSQPITSQPRSIPACTGNPGSPGRQTLYPRVYPRVYGESLRPSDQLPQLSGLSPRVRGIHRRYVRRSNYPGSIPACTGNPRRGVGAGRRRRVYPRVYGESVTEDRPRAKAAGLSPRVRGIPSGRPAPAGRARSIPACTGNPDLRRVSFCFQAVYPRVYGESIVPP